MPHRVSLVPTVMMFALLLAPGSARAVIVPDDYPTIQAALDAGEASVQVRDGLVPERITIRHSASIQPVPVSASGFGLPWSSIPSIQSMGIDLPVGIDTGFFLNVRGARFLGHVTIPFTSGSLIFEGCRFDSGFVGPTSMSGYVKAGIRNCLILGDVTVTSSYPQFSGNTVIGGKVSIWADGLHDIRDNYILGPADAGLELSLDLSDGPVAMNTIRKTGDGIRMLSSDFSPISDNDISDCSGDGIVRVASYFANFACSRNQISRCGRSGIAIRGTPLTPFLSWHAGAEDNTITDCGGTGIDLPFTEAWPIRRNTILRCGGDGFIGASTQQFESNVIVANEGVGFRSDNVPQGMSHNTIAANEAGDIVVTDGRDGVLDHNLIAFNGAPGMTLTGEYAPSLSCNDWFQNVGGATVGISPGATDAFLNPLFCDLPNQDVHLTSASPLIAAGECGLIGALGQGCTGEVAVEAPSNPAMRFMAWPVPSSGGDIRFALPPSSDPSSIEVFDVSGARIWETTVEPGAAAIWNRRTSSGASVGPGVYFVRVHRHDVEVGRTRVVLTR
jgi:hypothetical protein